MEVRRRGSNVSRSHRCLTTIVQLTNFFGLTTVVNITEVPIIFSDRIRDKRRDFDIISMHRER